MNDVAHSVEVHFAVDSETDRYGELIHRVAQESCHEVDDPYADPSFVMVTTEMRAQTMVKTVVFESDDCAQRFRALLSRAEPTLKPSE